MPVPLAKRASKSSSPWATPSDLNAFQSPPSRRADQAERDSSVGWRISSEVDFISSASDGEAAGRKETRVSGVQVFRVGTESRARDAQAPNVVPAPVESRLKYETMFFGIQSAKSSAHSVDPIRPSDQT